MRRTLGAPVFPAASFLQVRFKKKQKTKKNVQGVFLLHITGRQSGSAFPWAL
jgi:hypothetical protein